MVKVGREYDISKHRYEELKHFCLQYPDWQKLYQELNTGGECSGEDPTAELAIARGDLRRSMELVEYVTRLADEVLSDDILGYVTEGVRPEMDYPSEIFYNAVRRFFWLLDREKGI